MRVKIMIQVIIMTIQLVIIMAFFYISFLHIYNLVSQRFNS